MSPYSCPICSHSDWCWPHHATGIPCCRRQGRPDQLTYDRHGAPYYYHGEAEPVRVTRPEAMPLAPPDLRNSVYRSLWWLLTQTQQLTPEHEAMLHHRGILEIAKRAGVASWPADLDRRTSMARYLAHEHRHDRQSLLGVPGVYSERGSRLLRVGGSPGLAIPITDLQGRWVAVRMRPDNPGDRGKYQWLTSAGPARGDGPGPQFVPYLASRPGTFRAGHVRASSVVLTEGEPAQGAASGPGISSRCFRAWGQQLEDRPPHPQRGGSHPCKNRLGSRLAHQTRGCGRPQSLLQPP